VTELAPLPTGRPRRLVYLGTPAMAVPPLEALVRHGFDVALVVTRPDRRRGRGGELSASPVKAAAERLGLPVSHHVDDVTGTGADLGVVVAFGQLIRDPVLARLPMVNLHFSLLPRWRGAAPVERALLAGDTTTGVCLMQVVTELDAGPVLDRVEVPIGPRATLVELRRDLVEAGTSLLIARLERGIDGATPQEGEVTYAAKIDPAELRIDWQRPVAEIDRLVRTGSAWTTFRGKRLKVLEATPADGHGAAGTFVDPLTVAGWDSALRLDRVQPEGRPAMDAAAWVNGAHPHVGEVLGAPAGDG
jgi:methionyl-tRNA formyltransferase